MAKGEGGGVKERMPPTHQSSSSAPFVIISVTGRSTSAAGNGSSAKIDFVTWALVVHFHLNSAQVCVVQVLFIDLFEL